MLQRNKYLIVLSVSGKQKKTKTIINNEKHRIRFFELTAIFATFCLAEMLFVDTRNTR